MPAESKNSVYRTFFGDKKAERGNKLLNLVTIPILVCPSAILLVRARLYYYLFNYWFCTFFAVI